MIGVDEVGRGCWAGPLLVVAARQVGALPKGVVDSKLLTRKRREALSYDIQVACDIGEGWVDVAEIDAIGLGKAMYLGVERALQALGALPDEEIIMDGNVNYCPKQFTQARCVIDADATHPIVSAASIIAKVKRDQRMIAAAVQYPHYNFDKHVGYGTPGHRAALALHGICDLHRRSYKPIQALL